MSFSAIAALTAIVRGRSVEPVCTRRFTISGVKSTDVAAPPWKAIWAMRPSRAAAA